jgi:hypothetical protein
VTSTIFARKMFRDAENLRAGRGLRVHPDEQHLPLHVRLLAQVVDLDDVDELVGAAS